MLIDSLSSPAKNKIAKLLTRMSTPVSFRDLVFFTKIGIRSAQLALRDLKGEGIVRMTRHKNQTRFQIVDTPEVRLFRQMIEVEVCRELEKRTKLLQKRAKRTLSVVQGLSSMASRIDEAKMRR